MTEKIENQDVELQEDEEISETSHGGMKHDPKNCLLYTSPSPRDAS